MYQRRQWHPTPVLLPGKSHGWGSLVGCSPWGREESDTTEQLHLHFSLSCTGEGNGNPLHCSCLENPRDVGAWWVAVYGVAQSQTRLKWLSSSSSSTQMYIYAYIGGGLFIYLFFSSTSLLLATHLPSPSSCMCAQLCNPMDCSPPGSSVHGLFQTRIQEWVAISFSDAYIMYTHIQKAIYKYWIHYTWNYYNVICLLYFNLKKQKQNKNKNITERNWRRHK